MHEVIKNDQKKLGLRVLAVVFALALASSMALVGCSSSSEDNSSADSSSAATEAHESSTYGTSSSAEVQAGQAQVTIAIAPEGDINFGTVEEVVVPEGSTVYDALMATSSDVKASDGQYGKFVESIDGVANGSNGATSGWVYTINGQESQEACDAAFVNNGDVVEWLFVS